MPACSFSSDGPFSPPYDPSLPPRASRAPAAALSRWEAAARALGRGSVYLKRLRRDVRTTDMEEASPRLASGAALPARFQGRENGVKYLLSFTEGYSIGARGFARGFIGEHRRLAFLACPSGRCTAVKSLLWWLTAHVWRVLIDRAVSRPEGQPAAHPDGLRCAWVRSALAGRRRQGACDSS